MADHADSDSATAISACSAIAAEAGSYACRAIGDLPGAEDSALPDHSAAPTRASPCAVSELSSDLATRVVSQPIAPAGTSWWPTREAASRRQARLHGRRRARRAGGSWLGGRTVGTEGARGPSESHYVS